VSAIGAPLAGRVGGASVAVAWRNLGRFGRSHSRWLLAGAVTAAGIGGAILLLPGLGRLPGHLRLIWHGDMRWLAAGLVLEALSFAGQVVLFRAVYQGTGARIGYRDSYEITLAGHAATRLLASAGTGGIALTAWALRRRGLAANEIARRMIAFLVLMYAVYVLALVAGGLGLWSGALSGGRSVALTLAPAGLAAAVALVAMATPAGATRFAEVLRGQRDRGSRFSEALAKLAGAIEALADGVRLAWALIRQRRVGVLGAPLWWGFDLAVLWVSFKAFGQAPSPGVVLMAYFVGTLANMLPLPGGLGGVEGGMIGAFIAFGIHPELAVAAVLAYRLYAFWLPTIPGAIAYLQLRRRLRSWREPALAAA
jgi:uncharacterized protein (TIRG00374 family)